MAVEVKFTLDELVFRVNPNYVSVDNPKVPGQKTPGDAIVSSFKVDCDPIEGLMMYVVLEEENETENQNQEPKMQFEIWPAGSDRLGYPELITSNEAEAQRYADRGYEVRSYMAYPVI